MDRFGLEHFLPTAKRSSVARLSPKATPADGPLARANCWTDMLSEDDKRRTRPLWHYNQSPTTSSPRSARRVARGYIERCSCAIPARSSSALIVHGTARRHADTFSLWQRMTRSSGSRRVRALARR